MRKLITCLLAISILTSCGHAFVSNIRYQVEEGIVFTSAQEHIDRNVGFMFIWGGIIVNSVSAGDGGYLELAQTPLDKHERIINSEVSWGGFVVFVPSGFEKDELRPGQMISVAGVLTRGVKGLRHGQPYTYPVIESIEIRTWGRHKGPEYSPSLHLEQGLLSYL